MCRVPVGGGLHVKECKPGTAAELELLLRSGAHGAYDEDLPEPARLRPPVDDLAVARLLHSLESGVRVEPGGPGGWRASSARVETRRLGEVVREAIRVGLVRVGEVYKEGEPGIAGIEVKPAPVHALAHQGGPVCGDRSVLRYRVLGKELIRLVDCERCMDVPFSGVAYSGYE